MKKILIFCALFVACVWPTQTFAADKNFSAKTDVTYSVQESGLTHVTFVTVLTNNTTKYYAPSYNLKVGFTDIANVKANQGKDTLETQVTKTDSGNTISVFFTKKIVGKNESQQFNVSFDTLEIAQKHAEVWEINIPGFANSTDFSDFGVHMGIPSSFGKPTVIKPQVAKNTKTGMYDFKKSDIQSAGISVTMGTSQTYSFKLTYHLKNSHLFPVRTEMALPPTTNYQEVFIDSIDEKPLNVLQDKDGNWLAQYHLLPAEAKDIVVSGKVQLNLFPKQQELLPQERDMYLSATQYWPASGNISDIAKSLKTPEEIYNFVVKTLRYDYSRVKDEKPRVGAAGVLQNPTSAVCLEFTDLFIALARAAGIPAREIDGFAYTENEKQRPLSLVKDILHAWPQYYDDKKQTWVMVDPTWGNTTGRIDYFNNFDLDHIAFVVKGKDSLYPIPAGGYKYSGVKTGHDIDIGFAQSVTTKVQNVKLQSKLHPWYMAGLPFSAEVTLENVGNAVIVSQPVTVESKTLMPSTQTVTFKHIPPFGSTTLPFSFDRTSFLTNQEETITISVAGKSLTDKTHVLPFYATHWGAIGGILLAILSIGLFITTTRSRRIRVSHK
jgi:hypothetical protein